VGPIWVAIAAILCAFNLMLVIVGVTQRNLAALLGGYTASGGPFYLGIGVLLLSVLLFFYRRVVQDKKPITLRDRDVPTMPNAAQMALLQEEVRTV
jgi:membrane protein implicated in regulation of membrane protease activity